MLLVQKSLRLALVAAVALVVSAVESQAATPRFVFGKEPIARHNRAVAARRTQASSGYRMMASNTRTMPSSQSYGGTAMVQTYPVPQRSYVTPASGYRTQMAANNGAVVR
jgi:hypothetical protein